MGAEAKAAKVKLLVLDVDGVLTDGSMIYGNGGEYKIFYVRDGKGISLAKVAGIRVAIITSEKTELILNRAKKLEIEDVYLGIKNKSKCIDDLIKKYGLTYEDVAFVGDDINDIPILDKVGMPIAVNDAVDEIKGLVEARNGLVTAKKGGRGAVREAIEFILKSKGIWKGIVKKDVERQLKEPI